MMRVLVEDFSQQDLDAELTSDVRGVPLTTGVPLAGVLAAPLTVALRYRRTRPAAFAAGPIIVVDERVRQVLSGARTAIEFLPVAVTDRTTRAVEAYWFANVASELDCLDRTRSEFDDFKGYAQNIARLRLREGCAALDLFRLAWTLPPLIVVAGDLAPRLHAAGRLGFALVEVERYRDLGLV